MTTTDDDLGEQIAALLRMTVPQLRRRYAEVFREETPGHNKLWLIRRIAWRLQSQALGTLSERALRRADELANDADLRLGPPRPPADAPAPAPKPQPPLQTEPQVLPMRWDDRLPPPGTVLTRLYRGRSVLVTVLPNGFEYDGRVYRSLTAVAMVVTGTHVNGFAFFKLARKGGGQ